MSSHLTGAASLLSTIPYKKFQLKKLNLSPLAGLAGTRRRVKEGKTIMLRRISTGSIIISALLLMLASVTALAQTSIGVQSFDIAAPGGDVLRGIILVDRTGGGGTQSFGSTIWAQDGARAAAADTQETGGGFDGKIVMITNDSGAFLGLLYLGEGEMPFKGYIFGSK